MDAFRGAELHRFVHHAQHPGAKTLEASFSPDAQYVLSGEKEAAARRSDGCW